MNAKVRYVLKSLLVPSQEVLLQSGEDPNEYNSLLRNPDAHAVMVSVC